MREGSREASVLASCCGASELESRPDYPDRCFMVLLSPSGSLRDSALKYSTSASFHILFNTRSTDPTIQR
jgi:hypothetical protein